MEHNTNAWVRQQLNALADPDYRKFSAALLPGVHNLLGVRLPALRKLAKQLSRGDWRTYLAHARDDSFEEVMIQGMVIGCAKAELDERLAATAAFVPKIDNWSVCDSFCAGLKWVKESPERVWIFLHPYLHSNREFFVRFGVVMLLDHFLTPRYLDQVLHALNQVDHPGYYAKMAVAWAVSSCFTTNPARTMEFLRCNQLDDVTFHKALQKITESRLVDNDTKQTIRSMKRL